MGMGQGVLRQLVTLIGFRINTTEFRQAERAMYLLREQGMGIAAAGRSMALFVSVPIVLLARGAIQAGSNMQLLQARMEAFTGSAAAAKIKVKELMDFAIRSPMASVKDIGDIAGKMLAQNVSPQDLVPTMELLTNLKGALGGNIILIAKAFTDVKNLGRLQAQERRQFVNQNIPIVSIMGGYLGKTPTQIEEMMRKRLITFDMMHKALLKFAGPGSKIAEIVEKIAKTPWGQWQRFVESFYLLGAIIGQRVLPSLAKVLAYFSDLVGVFSHLRPNTYRFLIILGSLVALIGPLILFRGVLLSLVGPIGKIVAIATALSFIIEDIYGWTKGEKSMMGVLFGDYEKYELLIKSMRDNLLVVIRSIWEAIKGIADDLGRIGDFMGVTKDLNSLSAALWLVYTPLKGIWQIVNELSVAIRSLTSLPRLFSGDPADRQALEDLRRQQGSTFGGTAYNLVKGSRINKGFTKGLEGLWGLYNSYIGQPTANLLGGRSPFSYSSGAQSVQLSLAGGGALDIPVRLRVDKSGVPVLEAVSDSVSAHMAAKFKRDFHSPEKK